MDVGLGVVGHIVVDNVSNPGHVQTTGGDIGGNDDIFFATLEIFNGLFALTLVQVAAQGRHSVAACGQLLCQHGGFGLGAHENDRGVKRLNFQNAGQRIQLALGVDRQHKLSDAFNRAGFALDSYFGSVFQVSLGHFLDLWRHGGREERALAGVRRLRQDGFHVINEAHAQHFVGFVQYQCLQAVQLQGALAQMVEHAARCAHNNLGATLQAANLW